jgi:hypothetical protein
MSLTTTDIFHMLKCKMKRSYACRTRNCAIMSHVKDDLTHVIHHLEDIQKDMKHVYLATDASAKFDHLIDGLIDAVVELYDEISIMQEQDVSHVLHGHRAVILGKYNAALVEMTQFVDPAWLERLKLV